MSLPSKGDVDSATVKAAAGPHPAALAVGSGLLLWASFPPADWGWLAWGALVPLFLLVDSRRSARSVYFGSWLGGMAFWTLAVQWVRLTDDSAWLAWLAMALALSFFWPAFLALTRVGTRRLGLPLMIAAPIVWVALEYVRAYVVTGFPWYYLAHSQHDALPLIQIADLTGSLGVSFVIAVVNAWLADVLTLPLLGPSLSGPRLTSRQTLRLGVVAAMLALTLGYGAFRLRTASFRDGPRIALLQSSLGQRLKSGIKQEAILAVYEALVERARCATPPPDLIVWPETSYPYQFATIDPGLTPADLDRQAKKISDTFTAQFWRTRADRIAAHLGEWTDRLGVPMLVGVTNYDHRPAGMSKYNAAMLFAPGSKTPQSYSKSHLVPFGEYVPLIGTFPWLIRLTPFHGDYVPTLDFGAGPEWLDLGPYRIATAICFEDTVPQVVRRFFSEAPGGRKPDVLLNLSNDGWFKDSSEHEMHLVVSIFRAVEHRVPLARAANTGVSAIVDGNGRVLHSLAKLKEGVVSGVVPLDGRRTLYTAFGDWLGQSCLAVTIGLIPLSIFWKLSVRRRLAV